MTARPVSPETREKLRRASTKHGYADNRKRTRPPEYSVWAHIISRCENPRFKQYADYGGRGITMHPAWRASFPAFLAGVGHRPAPHLTLDRIDNDGNYEPGNVRWADRSTQNSNQRPLSHAGEKNCRATFTADQIPEIRSAHAAGESIPSIAARYDVSYGAVYGVVMCRTWKHIS